MKEKTEKIMTKDKKKMKNKIRERERKETITTIKIGIEK